MNTREEMKRWLAVLIQLAPESESKQIKADIDLLIGAVLQLTTELTNRNAALAKRCRSRKATPPKASPAKAPKQQNPKQSSDDMQDGQNDAEKRPKAISHIQQGIQQADPSLADQQRVMRGQVYGAQNNDVAFRKAAKAIAS